MSYETYVGLMTFTSIAAGISTMAVSFFIFAFFRFHVLHPILVPFLLGVLGGTVALGVCLSVPILLAYSRARKIEASLPVIANFMSVLATSGMPPGNMVRSLARVGGQFDVRAEAAGIMRDMDLLGSDLDAALRNASERSPSKKFAALLDGMMATVHMGGDLAAYLRDQSTKYKNARVLTMKTFLENLGVIAEVYVTFMVAAPIMLIVMLSVMAFIGGGVAVGNLDPKMLLNLLTFVVLPAGIAILIISVDTITPPR
jgi:flagellar protein FlaJ